MLDTTGCCSDVDIVISSLLYYVESAETNQYPYSGSDGVRVKELNVSRWGLDIRRQGGGWEYINTLGS